MSSQDNLTPFYEAMSSAFPRIAPFLEHSSTLLLYLLEHDGSIRWASRAMENLLHSEPGRNITEFTAGIDKEMVKNWLDGTEPLPDAVRLVNFQSDSNLLLTLNCVFVPCDNGILLFAEQMSEINNSLINEMMELNNRLTVISRENIRKGHELSRALEQLKSAQAMLIHQEKMASLGQMTAGIAHEINNPLAFVLNNEHVIQRDFSDLMAFTATLNEALPALAVEAPRIHSDLTDKAASLDIEYLSETLPRKISANIEGLERIRDIVRDLRTFSRLDEAERKMCSLREGIEASIRFMKPLLMEHAVTVETVFADLPDIYCAPGPLNQVISNILINAIQASKAGQTVRIATSGDEEWVTVEVSDQGKGIRPEHLDKVFNPFFTTKEIGSGTGLGLSIAHQVVTSHKGRIEIASSYGAGTAVRILIPALTCLEYEHD